MPQNVDPNYRANPIDALSLALANLHAEREEMLQLIKDYWQLHILWGGVHAMSEDYEALEQSIIRRTRKLLGD